jgi:hypothetical protein
MCVDRQKEATQQASVITKQAAMRSSKQAVTIRADKPGILARKM